MNFSEMLISICKSIPLEDTKSKPYNWIDLDNAKRHVQSIIEDRMREIILYIKKNPNNLGYLLNNMDQLLGLEKTNPKIYDLLVISINIPIEFANDIEAMIHTKYNINTKLQVLEREEYIKGMCKLYIGFTRDY